MYVFMCIFVFLYIFSYFLCLLFYHHTGRQRSCGAAEPVPLMVEGTTARGGGAARTAAAVPLDGETYGSARWMGSARVVDVLCVFASPCTLNDIKPDLHYFCGAGRFFNTRNGNLARSGYLQYINRYGISYVCATEDYYIIIFELLSVCIWENWAHI